MKDKIKIVVATHKSYEMPIDDAYLPLHVGAEGKKALGYQGDNTGDNISSKNSSYCELTGLYWAWKNIDAEYLGLVHYRRHFTLRSKSYRKKHNKMECVLSGKELDQLINSYDIILPTKQYYVIETLYSHYAHTHYRHHLDQTRKIIQKLYPEYLNDFYAAVNKRSGYMFNMFIMKKTYFVEYCEWLFTILSELEKTIGEQELSPFQGRFYGRVSEIIFNCWLRNKMRLEKTKVKVIPYFYTDKINWNKKIRSFLAAKFTHKKYEGSF